MSFEDRLSPFLLDGVSVRGVKKEDQSGSYGYVFEVEIGKVVHIAKKPHTAFLRKVSEPEKKCVISKFREECLLLSKLRHPNIVQFVGVYYGPGGRDDIALVMEKLECDLAGFLEDNRNLCELTKLTILQDVSYGLVYLHEYNPPVVHRDLTARNVLLSQSYQAKIADVGVAKLMDEKAKQAESHTQTPGQMYYMPPEARKENAVYTSKLDMFSFGHLSLHTVLGDYPVVYEDDITPEVLQKGNAQIRKRQSSLSRIGNQHCLYPSIVKCLMDNPEKRPTAREMNNMLNHLVLERNQHEQLTEKSGQQEQGSAALTAMEREKMTLVDQVTLYEQAAMVFEQDFRQERRDREQVHSKIIEIEDRYKHQMDALSAESQKFMEELKRQKKQFKDMESEYQARLSQLIYAIGEKDKKVAVLEERNSELEGDIATKTQQLKQYKKQADHLRDDLAAHKDVYETQKSQVELFVTDRETLQREVAKLQHENRNLQARVNHAVATNKSGSLTTVSDQMQELKDRALQLRNSLDFSAFNKAALSSSQDPPIYSSAASTTTSLSSDWQKGRLSWPDPLPIL